MTLFRASDIRLRYATLTPRQQIARLPDGRGRRTLRRPVVLHRVGELPIPIQRIDQLYERFGPFDGLRDLGTRDDRDDEAGGVAAVPAHAIRLIELRLSLLIIGVGHLLLAVDLSGHHRDEIVEQALLHEEG